MRIIPALDLLGGACVRLRQGSFAEAVTYGMDPTAVARAFGLAGARLIHLVDLDGARAGRPVQADLVRRIAADVKIPVEVGGGLRTMAEIRAYLDHGVARVVLGSAAVKDPGLLRAAVESYGDRVILGLDARHGRVATDGWTTSTTLGALDLARDMARIGLKEVIYTDIARDGMLCGPDLEGLADLARRSGLAVIASGGIASPADLEAAAAAGASGAIIGKAVYDGRIDLGEAIRRWEGGG